MIACRRKAVALVLAKEAQPISEGWRSSDDLSAALFDHSPVAAWICDKETLQMVAVNAAAIALYGYSREEFCRLTIADLLHGGMTPRLVETISSSGAGVARHGLWRQRKKNGTVIYVEMTAHPLVFEGRPHLVFMAEDLSEQIELQAQLSQSRKMESIGHLVGGVAHDFNNLLSVILSYSELFLSELEPDDEKRADMEELHTAARRAAELTRQLLGFSRRPPSQPSSASLNDVVAGMEKMLRRVIGEDITMRTVLAPSVHDVEVPPGQLEQILMNLVVNARDAMPTGGDLTIETAAVHLTRAEAAARPGTAEGPNFVLSVSDTGVGMDEATVARIFEPFFTTKDLGKGTGLGLSTVRAIVRQARGAIHVESERMGGTSFRVYFPVT